MAESKVMMNRPNSSSPPPNCAICLGTFTNKCFSDSCMHQFCFKCLLEWSKIKPECPLCKQSFKRIIHNVKSNEEYDEHVVEITPPEEIHIIDNEEFLFLPIGGNPQPSTRHHFHFRTTFTVDTRGEHAIQQMLLSHPLTNGGGQISVAGYPPSSRNIYHRRRRESNNTTSFRRSIYVRNLWVSAPPDVTGRYRDVSPAFYRDCPGARTRLVPWLNRELNALLYENTQLVMWLVDIIMDHLLLHHICSRTFRNLLYEYLDNKTDHFIHEFYNFMRSPFDMIGYDRNVIYTERPQSPPPYVVMLPDDVSDDGNDSDVIIVGSTNPEEPVVIDLVNTDSDEPIIVSQEGPPPAPLPLPATVDSSGGEEGGGSEARAPLLPLKLRLKHKRQSREKRREHRQKKTSTATAAANHRRRRSSSSSSSSTLTSSTSSSTSSDSSGDARKRHKRRKKLKQKKRPPPSHSSSNLLIDHVGPVENSSSDSEDNLPLSALAEKKKYWKRLANLYKSSRALPMDLSIRDGSSRVEEETAGRSTSMPSCSRYPSNPPPSQNGTGLLDIKEEVREHPSTSLGASCRYDRSREMMNVKTESNVYALGSSNAPTCSRYTRSNTESSSDVYNANGRREYESSEESYPQNLVKRMRTENRHTDNNGGKSHKANKRLKNLLIKKEDSSNTWYSYPYNNSSTSSED